MRLPPRLPDPGPSSGAFGGWYATVLHLRSGPLVVCVCEASLLSVVFPARRLDHFEEHLRSSLAELLAAIGVPEAVIARELSLLGPLIVSNTASPSLIGVLNNVVATIRHYASDAPPINPLDRALRLAKTPFKSIGYAFPADVALARLGLPKRVWPFPGGAT